MTRRPIDLQFFTRYIKAFRYRNVSTFSRIACLIVSGDRTKAHPVPFTDQRSVNSILSFSFSSFFLSLSLFHPIHRDIRKIKRLENKKKRRKNGRESQKEVGFPSRCHRNSIVARRRFVRWTKLENRSCSFLRKQDALKFPQTSSFRLTSTIVFS